MKIFCRRGSIQGFKHHQWGVNNQDAVLVESFSVPKLEKQYHVGIVCDGCTGKPMFSKTEVGASLLPVYAYSRCQELICSGMSLPEIPLALFQMCTEFLRDLANKVMPSSVFWPYPSEVLAVPSMKGRKDVNSTERFRLDYLSATMLGFITNEEQLVTFSAGDGVVLVNDELTVIDQNDEPDYLAHSINRPGKGFDVKTYNLLDVRRLALCSDGLKDLMKDPEFVDGMFSSEPGSIIGLHQYLAVKMFGNEDRMGDDCTAVTLENLEYEADVAASLEDANCQEDSPVAKKSPE